jgi:hypothetical protein
VEVFFKIKRQTLLNKMMTAYVQRQGVAADTVRSFYDGKRISGNKTPQPVKLS